MNVSFGYILSNNETGEYRYYYSSDNTTVLPKPKLVENFEQFKLLKQDIFSTEFIEKFTNFRDSTKWSFFCLPNVSLHATHLSRLPMGSTDQDVTDIPDFTNPREVCGHLPRADLRKEGLMITFPFVVPWLPSNKTPCMDWKLKKWSFSKCTSAECKRTFKILRVLSIRTCQTLKSFVLPPSECFQLN